MERDEQWPEPYENDGLTLGPEEALRKEIEKSKALKVERLRLQDATEKLRAENAALAEKNTQLERENQGLRMKNSPAPSSPPATQFPAPWAVLLFLVNLAALLVLAYFLMRK